MSSHIRYEENYYERKFFYISQEKFRLYEIAEFKKKNPRTFIYELIYMTSEGIKGQIRSDFYVNVLKISFCQISFLSKYDLVKTLYK